VEEVSLLACFVPSNANAEVVWWRACDDGISMAFHVERAYDVVDRLQCGDVEQVQAATAKFWQLRRYVGSHRGRLGRKCARRSERTPLSESR